MNKVARSRLLLLAGVALAVVGAVLWFVPIELGIGRIGHTPGQIGALSGAVQVPNEAAGNRVGHPSSPRATLSAQGGQRGALWTGRIESTRVQHDGQYYETTVYAPVRLREYHHPLLIQQADGVVRAGTTVLLFSEGTVVGQQHSLTPTLNGSCPGDGSGSATITQPLPVGTIWKKSANLDTTPSIDWNVPPGPGLYKFNLKSEDTYLNISPCRPPSKSGFEDARVGRLPIDDWEVTGGDPQMRLLDKGGGRMSGSYSIPVDSGQQTVSWNICREGVDCGDCPIIQAEITLSAGFIFINPSGKAEGRQRPADSCSEVVGVFPNGARLVYRRVVLNKDTGKPDWYLVEPPGGTPGWIPAGDTSNTRPVTPIPTRPLQLPPPPSVPGTITDTPMGAVRG